MNCDCVNEMNRKLADKNVRIATAYRIVGPKMLMDLIVASEKIDTSNRKNTPLIIATFCPFCGGKIHEEMP